MCSSYFFCNVIAPPTLPKWRTSLTSLKTAKLFSHRLTIGVKALELAEAATRSWRVQKVITLPE
jgi:hypothetical protein